MPSIASATGFEAAAGGCAHFDAGDRGRFAVRGKDRVAMLHRLSTNEVRNLEPPAGTTTVLTTDKGRIVDLVTVLFRADDILVLTSRGRGEADRKWLDRYVIREDARFVDLANDLFHLLLLGPRASEVLSKALAIDVSALPPWHYGARDGWLAQPAERYLGSRGINLIGPASERDAIAAKLASAGSVAIDGGTFDAIRVSSRIPTHPAELNEERNPWEARLDGSISLVKGCYIGQEVVARLDTYKKVHRSLVHLDLDGDALPAVRAPVVHEGRDVGYVSSAVVNPRTGRVEALGYLLGDLAEPGKIVTVGGASGRVDPVEPWAKAQGA